MQTDEALAAEQALEAKLASAGLDQVRRHTFSEPQAAPAETGTPAEEPTNQPPLRDEQGRFTSTQQPEAETAVEAPAEPAVEQPATADQGQDPAVAAYLQKYGGDTTKALQAAVAAQRKLGEMGSEVGEQRKIIAELEQLQQTVLQMQQPQQYQPMVPDQATVDWIDEQIMTNPASAQQFAVQALQANQPLLYDRIMESWFQVQPRSASRFENALAVEQAKQEMRAAAPAQNDAAEMQNALTNVLAQHPEFNQYADQLDTAIERYPVVSAGLRGNSQEKQNAIETLFALAERDTLRALAFAGATPAAESSTADVVTPTTSEHNPAEPQPEPTAQDVFREQFRQAAKAYTGERVVPGAYVAR